MQILILTRSKNRQHELKTYIVFYCSRVGFCVCFYFVENDIKSYDCYYVINMGLMLNDDNL